MTPDRLNELISQFSKKRILVIGDFFLDKYLEVDSSLAETSLETERTAHQVTKTYQSPGAAGTIVSNLAALGAGQIDAIGFTGEDGAGYELRRALTQLDCSTQWLFQQADKMTPVYLKPREKGVPGLEGEHDRYDFKNRKPIEPEIEARIIEALDRALEQTEAVIIADQVTENNCGVVTDSVRSALSARALNHPSKVFIADSRTRIQLFKNVMTKPNQFEIMSIDDPLPGAEISQSELREAVLRQKQLTEAPVFCTRGSAGIMVSDPEPEMVRGITLEGILDTTGAGDSVSAGTVLALTAGASFSEAALIGNLVASITVQQLNTTGTARPEQLPGQLEIWQQQMKLGL